MGRLVLFVLMWGAVWTEEYGIGGIPQYGAGDYSDISAAGLPPLDYTEHSPDASPPLDYKYVEDSNANQDKYLKDEVMDQWQKPKKRTSHRFEKAEVDAVEPNHFIKHRSNHRQRHRSRLKKSRINEPHRRRRLLPDRLSEDNIDDDSNQYRDELKQETPDVDEHIQLSTTEKIIRRKPRDRRLDFSENRSDSEDDFVELDSKIKNEEKFVPQFSRVNSIRHGRPPPPPDENELEEEKNNYIPSKSPRRKPEKNYRDYNEYYDMNRVNNIKSRLPLLIRRTSTEMPVSLEYPYPPPKELMEILANARRAGDDAILNKMVRTKQPEKSAVFIDVTKPPKIEVPEIETTSTSISTTPAIVTEALTSTTFQKFSSSQSHELSLAEKSRLSILKKALKKEKEKPGFTTKPPILLRVTNRLNTIIMIEPKNDDPWLRAREVSDDSPERLDKVKRLIRNKLVAEARDIRDLTDNWNDLICEYIDTSLLDSGSSEDRVNLLLLIVLSLLNIIMCHLMK